MKTFLALIIFLTSIHFSSAQTNNTLMSPERPKLVVGVVVDQMRYDYLTRFYHRYGDGGFKKLINQGFNCKNNHYNYVPTYTGPGHASIYTGTTPKYHGIIGNNWYDKASKEWVYVVSDSSVSAVGTTGYAGQMSPHRMKSTTFADENRLFTQMRGKSVGISLKDRGAILPAGHTANAAYWFQGGEEGVWVSSSFYMNELPKWVQNFNNLKKTESYLSEWNTLYDIESYTESGDDINEFETKMSEEESNQFPYKLKQLYKISGDLGLIRSTPFGNSLTTDFAMAAIDAEALGADQDTDVLTVSYSSTDYIGHSFGVNSKEIQDAYLRLDKDIERLINKLDESVGQDNYVMFLTSDHGAIDVPAYLASARIPSGYFNGSEFRMNIAEFVEARFKTDSLIENISNDQIFLNRRKLKQRGIDIQDIQDAIVNEIISYPYIDKAYTAKTMTSTGFDSGVERLIQLGYNQKRSGDVIYVLDPAVISYGPTGSTHGSSLNYDTHVPLIFYGKGIAHGSTFQRTEITDIAPTISALLGISFPNSSIGTPLEYVFK